MRDRHDSPNHTQTGQTASAGKLRHFFAYRFQRVAFADHAGVGRHHHHFFSCVSLFFISSVVSSSSLMSSIRDILKIIRSVLSQKRGAIFCRKINCISQVAEKAQKNILNSSVCFFFPVSCVFLLFFLLFLASLSFFSSCFFAFCKKTFFSQLLFALVCCCDTHQSHHRRRRTSCLLLLLLPPLGVKKW